MVPNEMLLISSHRPAGDLIGLQATPGRTPQVLRLPSRFSVSGRLSGLGRTGCYRITPAIFELDI